MFTSLSPPSIVFSGKQEFKKNTGFSVSPKHCFLNGNTLNDFVTQPLPPPTTRLAALLPLLLLLDNQRVAAVRVAGFEPLAHWRVVGLLVVFAGGWIARFESTVRSHVPESSYKF